MKFHQKFALGALTFVAALLVTDAYALDRGYLINVTASVPRGIWQSTPSTAFTRGETVTFCPPITQPFRIGRSRGYIGVGRCPGRYELMIKPIAALPGDVVHVDRSGVAINGHLIRNSKPLARDQAGRPLQWLKPGTYVVAPGEAWVISDFNRFSFDSRYFGPIPLNAIRGVARPVWTEARW